MTTGHPELSVTLQRGASLSPPEPVPPPAPPAVPHRVLLVLGALIVLALVPWLSGLLGGLVLAACTRPVHRRLVRHLRPRWSAALITVGVTLLLLIPGTWLVATATGEAVDALRRMQQSDVLLRLGRIHVAGLDVARQVESLASTVIGWLPGRALALFGSATKATLNLLIALFSLFYLLVDGSWLGRRIMALLHVRPEMTRLLEDRFVLVTEALVIGTLLTATVQGVLVGTSFALVGLRGAVLWGVVTACVSVLPVLGASFVWLPGVAVLAAGQRYGAALLLLAIGTIIISNMDNVVRLIAYRRISGLHPMITLVGAIAGAAVFGIAGVFIGPLVLSYFFELLRLQEAGTTTGVIPGRTP